MAAPDPTFSVVIPTHGRRRSLREAVGSVLAQTHTDFELFVVADGDVEHARDALADLDDPRLQVLGQAPLGVAAARNHGLRLAAAPWVTFLDDDDRARPEWLSAWAALAGPDSQVVTGTVGWTGAGTRADTPCGLDPSDPTMAAATLLAGGFAARADLLRAVGGYDESLRASENHDLGLRLCDHLAATGVAGGIAHSSKPTVDVHVEPSTPRASRYGSARRDAALAFLDRHRTRLAEDPSHLANLLRIISHWERTSGSPSAARSAAWRATKVEPRNPANARALLLALVPALARLQRA